MLACTHPAFDGPVIRARSSSFWRQTAPLERGKDPFRGNIRPCSWSSSGTAKKEGSPSQGWGDTGAGGLFLPGRALKPGVDLLRPVQGVFSGT